MPARTMPVSTKQFKPARRGNPRAVYPKSEVANVQPVDGIIPLPRAFQDLCRPARYKVFYGGRGASRSWSFSRVLIARMHTETIRVGCFREIQTSIKDSVHQTLVDMIDLLKLRPWFYVTKTGIWSHTGSQTLYRGLRTNVAEVKSMEGLDVAWVEEAQAVSVDSWRILRPTMFRKKGSEIWLSFNTGDETDATYEQFVLKPPGGAIVRKVTWKDNPFFPPELNEERLAMLASDPDAYSWVWDGDPRTLSDAVIFRGRYVVEPFETPQKVRFYHGMDFGFANDPSFLVRCFITKEKGGEHLWIDREAVGYGVEFDELPQLMRSVETASAWPIKADNSRPETISYLKRFFNINEAKKWNGSVEDGIAHLKGFKKIHIHSRCEHMAREARLYSYKVDRITKDVLPVVVSKHDHGWDGCRYALDGYIKHRGASGVWARL